jgi:hypothetical protein
VSKYAPLTSHLRERSQSRVPMRFEEIERLLGFPLPASARKHRAWWSNNPSNSVMTKAWLDAGYQSEQVDLEAEKLTFARLNAVYTVQAPAHEAKHVQRRSGPHPLIGCMAGTITFAEGVDLTEPMFSDEEIEAWADRKAALLRGEQS